MCGISGIVFKKNNVDNHKIISMNETLSHRGPDHSGYLRHKNLLLGHTRLSIIDLSSKGTQPMSSDGRFWIIYNGEIYNYLDLKEELIQKNYKFYSDTDTEVVLNAYIEWKEKCFEKFNGEWALSILDKKENTLIICRDGIGYKPCYIYEDEMYFAFSSEIKSFYCLYSSLDFNLSNIGIKPETLSYSSKTVFTNVSQLTQGRLIKINLQDNKKKNFRWDYPLHNLPKIHSSYKENTKNYFDLLYTSTKLRLNSDVKIGTSLSGGLDSSAIFTLLNLLESNDETKKTELDLNPIIMNYAGMKSKNEALELSKMYKRKYKIIENHDEDIDQTKNIISSLETIEEYFMQYNLYKHQSERGIKVSLDGHGSDEFLGYPHFYPELSVDIFNNLMNTYKTLMVFAGKNTQLKFKKLFGINNNPSNEILFKTNPDTKNYLSDYIEIKDYDASFQIINDDLEDLEEFSYSVKFTYLIAYCGWFQFFLNKWDKASMSNSVEVRMPFLDPNVRLFSLALSTDNKIRNGTSKSILRDAFKDYFPKSILNQTFKQGLSQHKFDFSNQKYKKYILEILNEKDFKEMGLWDIKKINDDYNNNQNINKIWILCKYFLMIKGFDEKYKSIEKNINIPEKFNYLCEPI